MKNRVWAIVAALVVALALQVGLSAAATGTSGASASEVWLGNVRIRLQGSMSGPQFAAFGRGRFTISGAISDRGTFVDEFHGVHPPSEPHSRTLRSANGTLRFDVSRTGQWRIIHGTKAYAGFRGRGTLQGRYRFTGIDATMIGTVSP